MTSNDFKAWIKKHNLNVDKAVKVLGMTRSNAYEYAAGRRPVNKVVQFATEVIDRLPDEEREKLFAERIAK